MRSWKVYSIIMKSNSKWQKKERPLKSFLFFVKFDELQLELQRLASRKHPLPSHTPKLVARPRHCDPNSISGLSASSISFLSIAEASANSIIN
jgi:hypothetical protein